MFEFITDLFKPRPPKYQTGDRVMFESSGKDYEATVIGFDNRSEAIALEIISGPRQKPKWTKGDKITLAFAYEEYRSIVIISKVSDKANPSIQ